MKFYFDARWTRENGNATKKVYLCTSCYYKRAVMESKTDGEPEVLEGDQEFILFPFSSFTKIDGSHAELCACPKCGTVQIIDRVNEEQELDHYFS